LVPAVNAYYNENDPNAAAWLRELIKHGHIAAGEVDERSIEDVIPNDLRGFTQCHFFAGIGGWSLALRLAGWADDRPVWTGSCPCQPFSLAGAGAGFADERHLWPAWFYLIGLRRPPIVFGEQVANSDDWFDLVSTDLEGKGYAVGSAVLGAHSVGAPHIRRRRYFVGIAASSGRERVGGKPEYGEPLQAGPIACELGDAGNPRLSVLKREVLCGAGRRDEGGAAVQSGSPFWADCDWLPCRDGKTRPVEPGTFPLANGIPGRVGLLRGYGNAIVPQVAAEFIKAVDGDR
jgi:DNA (cytosine-5)-methyltransferase 1